jgi:hypothetical protein
LRLRRDGERPSGIALLRSYTLRDVVAAPAILARELYLNDGILAVIDGWRPADTGLASRTSRVLLAPIDLDMLRVKAGACAGLPVTVEACGPQQIDAVVVATLPEEFGAQEAGVDDMGAGQQVPLLQHGQAHREVKPIQEVFGLRVEVELEVARRITAIRQKRDLLIELVTLRLEHFEEPTFGLLVIGLDEGKAFAGDGGLGLLAA